MPEMYIDEAGVLVAGGGGVVSPGVARPCENSVSWVEIWRSSRACPEGILEVPGKSKLQSFGCRLAIGAKWIS